jgi:adenylate cyclase
MTAWDCPSCGGANPAGTRFCGHCGAPAGSPARQADPAEQPPADVAEALRSFVAGPVADRLAEAAGQLPEERRLITALFADVSGFTALAERLDPEELQEVIDPVIAALSSVVGRYEGYVEKFAGDALLALYGAPVSHDDDADRALLTALEMHNELARRASDLPHDAELSLHVGLNSGHGIARVLGSSARMDYAVLGDSVILAQRLESAAPAGATYVSESTMRLARGDFEFEPVGELTLKGKTEPVPAWRLVGRREGTHAAHVRLVGRRADEGQPRLVGRDLEVDAALAALDGGVVTVTGEPGVGKSRLTDEVRATAKRRGVHWLQTRCVSYGAALPYLPYAELLRNYDGGRQDDRFFAQLLGAQTAEPDLEPQAFRRGLHDSFARWLRDLAAAKPAVLAIEDVHWADASSIELTRELARLASETHLTLYLIARPEAEEVLASLGDQTEIQLRPLGVDDTRALVEAVLGSRPPKALVKFVAQRTGGNPFFVGEVLRSLEESNALERVDGRRRLRPGWDRRELPATVEEVLAARLDLLPRSTTAVLQTASVIGRRVALALLREVHDGDADVDVAVEELAQRRFVDRTGADEIAFHHALVQDAAYARLLRRRRRDLHRRVAEVAERLYGSGDDVIDLLARHLFLGDAGPRAVEYLVRAGNRAERLYANGEAILHFTRAAELAPEDTDLRLQLAGLQELVGDYDSALAAYRHVRDASRSEVRAWAGIASTHRKRGEYVEALEIVDEAFRTDDLRAADLAPLWLEQAWTLSVAGRFDQAIDVLQAGLAAEAGRRDSTVGQILLRLARAETVEGQLESALTHAREAEAMLDEATDLPGLVTTMRLLGDVLRNRGDLDEAADSLRRGLELATKTGNVEEIGGCLVNLALVELDRGRLDESIACSRRAIEEFERIGHPAGLTLGYGNLAFALSRSGAYEEASRYAQQALELAESIGNSMAVADIRDTVAEIRLGQGHFLEAAAEAEEAARLFLEMGASTMAKKALGVAAEAWEKAGEAERARASEQRARSLVST